MFKIIENLHKRSMISGNLAARYYPQSFLPPELSRSWMKPPVFRYSLKTVLFKKQK